MHNAMRAEQISFSRLVQQQRTLPARLADSHKGDFGHVLVLGGNVGFGGAALLASEAALRTGAGLVSCALQADYVGALLSRCPSVMARAVQSGLEVQPLLERATVLAVGPGLGQDGWAELLLQQALNCSLPMVLDADGLNILAKPNWQQRFDGRTVVLTPHAAEAARLLNCTVTEVQQDRSQAALELAQCYQALVVLKGKNTIVAAPDGRLAVCQDGNAGMSTGGMGDVLTGVIAALLAQHAQAWDAVCLGVCLHSHAADVQAEQLGMRGLLASDLFASIQRLNNV